MKKQTLDFLRCPKCNRNLILIKNETAGEQATDWLIHCVTCESTFGGVLEDWNNSEYFWDIYNHSTVGLYLTKWEQHYIDQTFQRYKFIGPVLDIGCGSGRFTIPISQKGFNVVALEYSRIPLLKLKSKESATPIILGDGGRLPFKNKSFDCIICIQVLDYFDSSDRSLFFRECNRVLKDEGFLLFSSINKYSYKRIIRRLASLDNCPYPKPSDLKRELHSSGFVIKEIKGYDWVPVTRWNNSKFVYFFTLFEGLFKLEKLPLISPRLFITARALANRE